MNSADAFLAIELYFIFYGTFQLKLKYRNFFFTLPSSSYIIGMLPMPPVFHREKFVRNEKNGYCNFGVGIQFFFSL